MTMKWYLVLGLVFALSIAPALAEDRQGALHGGAAGPVNAILMGAKPDGTTDNTALLQSLLDSLKSFGYNRVYDRPALYLPAGRYMVSGLRLDSCQGVRIFGDGPYATTIIARGNSDTVFAFSRPTQHPSNLWQGATANIDIENVSIRIPSQDERRKAGQRGGIAIMDNGGGGVHLRNVVVRGFRYGFCAPFGSDFSRIEDAEFVNDDVGIYLGPGSQQYRIVGTTFTTNQEDIVLEGATQGHITDCAFIDAKSCAICVSADRTTRFGIALDKPWVHEYSLTISDSWFETGAGADTQWDHPADIITRGDAGGSKPRHVRVENCYLVSGVSGMAAKRPGMVYVFWDNQSGTDQLVRNLLIFGNRIDAVVNIAPGTYPRFVQDNTSFVDGARSPLWNRTSPNAIERSPFVR